MQLTDALNPALNGFGILLSILQALHFNLLLETETRACPNVPPQQNQGLSCIQEESLHPPSLPLTATLCCLEFSVNQRERTVGSDCLVDGSSSTSNPRLSGFPSGRGTYEKQARVSFARESFHYSILHVHTQEQDQSREFLLGMVNHYNKQNVALPAEKAKDLKETFAALSHQRPL